MHIFLHQVNIFDFTCEQFQKISTYFCTSGAFNAPDMTCVSRLEGAFWIFNLHVLSCVTMKYGERKVWYLRGVWYIKKHQKGFNKEFFSRDVNKGMFVCKILGWTLRLRWAPVTVYEKAICVRTEKTEKVFVGPTILGAGPDCKGLQFSTHFGRKPLRNLTGWAPSLPFPWETFSCGPRCIFSIFFPPSKQALSFP